MSTHLPNGHACPTPPVAVPIIPVAPPDPTPRATDFDAVDAGPSAPRLGGKRFGLRDRYGWWVMDDRNCSHPFLSIAREKAMVFPGPISAANWREGIQDRSFKVVDLDTDEVIPAPDHDALAAQIGASEDHAEAVGPWDHAELGEASDPDAPAAQHEHDHAADSRHARDHAETPGVMPDPPAPPRPSTYLGGHPVADPPRPDHPTSGRVAALSAIDRAAGSLLALVGKGQKIEGVVCDAIGLIDEARRAVEGMPTCPPGVRFDPREPEAVESRGLPATCPPPDPATGDPGGAVGGRFDAAMRRALDEFEAGRVAAGPTERWGPYRGPWDKPGGETSRPASKPAGVTLDRADLAYIDAVIARGEAGDEEGAEALAELRGYFKGIGRGLGEGEAGR